MMENIKYTIPPLKKIMKGLPPDKLAADGLLYQDWEALTPCQHECITRLGSTVQLEQEAYLTEHPEIRALCETYIKMAVKQANRRINPLISAGAFFSRPKEELDKDIRDRTGSPQKESYVQKPTFKYKDLDLKNDLKHITLKHYPPEPWNVPTPSVTTLDTISSDFISVITSDSTLPTPEPVPTPEPTLSEMFINMITNTVYKAVYSHVDDDTLRYDTAYVELMKVVENAMEIPVIDIKEDIGLLFYNAYQRFEMEILEKERIAAELCWEKRMRKKLKRTLRRLDNFKGYETPPTPKSEISSHESWKKPPQRPCECNLQFRYNRYPKDRFGIYLPRDEEYSEGNITVTPAISMENLEEEAGPAPESKSIASKKSAVSMKSAVSRKATFKT